MKKIHLKLIAVTTVFSLIWANITPDIIAAVKADKVRIPVYSGNITDQWQSDQQERFVIHIKDSHCNYETQNNIFRILESLIRNNDIKLVAMEGAAGEIDTSPYRVFPDKNTRESVCDNFVKKGVLTGAESLSICNGSEMPFTLWGIEDQNLYIENLFCFRNTMFENSQAIACLDKIKSALDTIRKNIYPEALYTFEQKTDRYYSDTISLTDWAVYLRSMIAHLNLGIYGFDEIENLAAIVRLEAKQLAYAQFNLERKMLLKEIDSVVDESQMANISKYDINYELGKLSALDYLEQLSPYFLKNTEKYPVLISVYELEQRRRQFNHENLLSELESAENAVRNALADKSGDIDLPDLAIRIHAVTKSVYMHEKLVRIQFTYKELNDFDSGTVLDINDILFDLDDIAQAHNFRIAPEISSPHFQQTIAGAAASAMKFYDTADKRSQVMAANLVRKMDESDISSSVIISGGFHSAAIEQILRENNISYLTITPASSVSDTETYTSLMLNEQLDLRKPQLSAGRYISFPVLLSSIVDDSSYFSSLRQDLAKSMLQSKGLSLAEYRNLLKNDSMLITFNRLVAIANSLPGNKPEITSLDELMANISPEAVSGYILSYDNAKITREIMLSGISEDTIEYNEKKVFADYLLSLLSIVLSVNPGTKSESGLLKLMLKATFAPDQSILNKAIHDRLAGIVSAETPDTFTQAMTPEQGLIDEKTAALALTLAVKLAEQTGMELSPDFSISDMSIAKTGMPFVSGQDMEDRIWFDMTIKTAGGQARTFRVKSALDNDISTADMDGFTQIDFPRFPYFFMPEQFESYKGFHVNELTDSIPAIRFNAKDQYAPTYSELLGQSAAIAFVLGLENSTLDNIHVEFKNGEPARMINSDLTAALRTAPPAIPELMRPFGDFLARAKAAGVTAANIDSLALSFLIGFENTLSQVQDYYYQHYEHLAVNTVLNDSVRWKPVLSRMDSAQTDILPIITSAVTYLNSRYSLNIRAKAIDDNPLNTNETTRIQHFIEKQQFSRFNPEDPSMNSALYTNKTGTVFLKKTSSAISRIRTRSTSIVDLFRNPAIVIKVLLTQIIAMTTLPGGVLAAERLGGLVPPMYQFISPKGVKVNGDIIKEGVIQQKVRYISGRQILSMAKAGKIDEAKRIIDQYFEAQKELWKRGVFDRDMCFHNNYGFDDLNTIELKCIDVGGLVSNPVYAAVHILLNVNFNTQVEILRSFLPEELAQHYVKRYHEIFTLSNFITLWNSAPAVPAQQIMLNQRVTFSKVADGSELGPVTLEKFQMKYKESQLIQNFVAAHRFRPLNGKDAASDMTLFISENGKFILKASGSVAHTVKSYMKSFKFLLGSLAKKLIEKPLIGIAVGASAGVLMATSMTALKTVVIAGVATFAGLALVIMLTKSPIGRWFLGPFMPILTPQKVQIANKRLGGLVVPSYQFDVKNGIDLYYGGETLLVKNGLIQEKMDYTLESALKNLAAEGRVHDINRLIDRYFEAQEQMWARCVFDIDFLSFSRNYGVNDLHNFDVRMFDIGGVTNIIGRAILSILYEAKLGKPFVLKDLREIIPEECVQHYSQRYNETFSLKKLFTTWNKADYAPAQSIDLAEDIALQQPQYGPQQGLPEDYDIDAISRHIDRFLADIGLEDDNVLRGKIFSVYTDFVLSRIPIDIYSIISRQKSLPNMAVRMVVSQSSYIHKPLVKMSMKLMKLSGQKDFGGIFMAVIETAVIDHILRLDKNEQPRINPQFKLIDQSL
ncbi:MAG: hypothetical protein AB1454_13750 [Candidatus Auribacterota bacterium]